MDLPFDLPFGETFEEKFAGEGVRLEVDGDGHAVASGLSGLGLTQRCRLSGGHQQTGQATHPIGHFQRREFAPQRRSVDT